MAYLGNNPLNAMYNPTRLVATQGQKTFNLQYQAGSTLFLKNGALLDPQSDYTATDGATLTLTNACNGGDWIQAISLAQFSVANAAALNANNIFQLVNQFLSRVQVNGAADDGQTALLVNGNVGAAAAIQSGHAVNLGQFGTSQGSSGYQKFPNGLILQWGIVSVNSTAGSGFNFPTAFPNACVGIVAADGGSGCMVYAFNNYSKTGATGYARTPSGGALQTGVSGYYYALGY